MSYDLNEFAEQMEKNIKTAHNKKEEIKRKKEEEAEKARSDRLEKVLSPLLRTIPQAILENEKEVKVMDLIAEIDYNRTSALLQGDDLIGTTREIFKILKTNLKVKVELLKVKGKNPRYAFEMVIKIEK